MAEWNKKRDVMRNYDRLAPTYDVQYAEEQNEKMKTALRSAHIKDDGYVLDLGCGTGLLFEHVGNRAKLLVGLDVSTKVLKVARKRAKRFPNVVILRADADLTPFPNEIFDAVFAITLLQNMPNPLSTLQEMRRISKHHAFIAITGLKKEFALDAFTRLLNEADLKVSVMKTDNQLKGYVATCRKIISN
ncbi:MAG: class I SAM-dependent methyltransferase [Candidatus Bathyarchaeia archaeon]